MNRSLQHRGCGYGNHAIRKLAEYVFASYEHVIRLEGHTIMLCAPRFIMQDL
ncbi:hypothetical protein FHR92_002049 [Fontibacillus solani]|uniref:Uncharacterized protein n=1 Tax=Fontibacillus solani TaxID=1572857 RepID=A0A7W3SSY1_9BACL|nr:hypothetical protein [Fontibacillus solani]MBA9085582.1 hypothetical protein [Fontibacillus solani]